MAKIKNQKEADRVLKFLTLAAIEKLGLSSEQAELRVKALVESGILDDFDKPDDKVYMYVVDMAMRIPQLEREKPPRHMCPECLKYVTEKELTTYWGVCDSCRNPTNEIQ